MSIPESIASIAGATAWPLIVLVVIIVLREPIKSWLRERPKSVAVGRFFTVEWEVSVKRTQAELALFGIGDRKATLPKHCELRELDIKKQPYMAICRAASVVEEELNRKFEIAQVPVGQVQMGELATLAQREGLISQTARQSISGLVTLSNRN